MVNIVYLLLVMSTHDGGMTSQLIPQSNMAQCQVNVKNLKGRDGSYARHDAGIKATCIAGVK